jgi:hypothetical protein
LLCAAGLFAGLAVVAFSAFGISRLTINGRLENIRQELEGLRPRAATLQNVQKAVAANRGMLSEFKNWAGDSGLPMHTVLRAAQEEIPAEMELYHFTAGVEPSGEEAAVARTLYISGSADDEAIVIKAKRQLTGDSRLRSFCGEVNLASLKRYSGKSWAFALEGRRLPGGDK